MAGMRSMARTQCECAWSVCMAGVRSMARTQRECAWSVQEIYRSVQGINRSVCMERVHCRRARDLPERAHVAELGSCLQAVCCDHVPLFATRRRGASTRCSLGRDCSRLHSICRP